MRWDNLRLDVVPSQGLTAPLFEQGAVARRFDTPEFKGMTFYEVQAKSIINHVPEASRVPFRWTINPYRGCQHACLYCLSGETPILMADGRTKPLAALRIGDQLYGTTREGGYRRFVRTVVENHWSTVKPAYRVTLQDGTELIASGDHRFLSDRGWKHVAGAMAGAERRPYLTTNNRLMGTGSFAPPPEDDVEYRRGYLCGMIRGDGHVGSYSYPGRRRVREDHHRFRLALVDLEGVQRTRRYLLDFQVATTEFLYQRAAMGTRALEAIRASSRMAVETIGELIAWPRNPTPSWQKGFLAGIFDAEGSFSQVIRIPNTDPAIIEHTVQGLDTLGFRSCIEDYAKPNGLRTVRLLGGLPEVLRFFHTVDPAITRKRTIEGRALKIASKLRVTSIEPLGIDMPMYDITTGTGDFIANGVVSHNCFARNTHTYLDLNSGNDFDTQVVVKVNAAEKLRQELGAGKWKGEHIAMGTNVDPYQRAEGRYKLMRGILEAMRDSKNPFSILTKGTLILRDIDLLQQCAEVADVATNVSVGSVDRDVWRGTEKGTPNPRKRLDACKELNDAGIPCGVLMAPVLPYISDDEEMLEETVRAIAEAGATHVYPIALHLRTGAREWFLKWLHDERPDLVATYEDLYGNRAYAPTSYQQELSDRVHALARRYGIGRNTPATARRITPPASEPPPEQLELL